MGALVSDRNLAQAIRETIGKPEGDLVPEDLESITELSAIERKISGIEGLQHCTRLRNLFLDNNRISDLWPLAELFDLRVLHLDGNKVRNLKPIAGLAKLTVLGLDSNPLKNLEPISELTGLARLALSADGIKDLSALVECEGLGSGDWIYFTGTPAGEKPFMEQVAVLRKRGVLVYGVP